MSQPVVKLIPHESPPQSQESTISRLLEIFDELPPQLQTAARFIIDHPHEVGVQTMRSLAAKLKSTQTALLV